MEQLNNERELTREERLEIEEKAIQALVNMGVKFNVPLKINQMQTFYRGSIMTVKIKFAQRFSVSGETCPHTS